jgi:putative membrane protein
LTADRANVSDHLANERTYLAWVRTGIAIIALGFVVARFGLFLREISPVASPATSIHISSILGVALVLVGGFMELLALKRFVKNQERIRIGVYQPTATVEMVFSVAIFIFAILIIAYLLLTS